MACSPIPRLCAREERTGVKLKEWGGVFFRGFLLGLRRKAHICHMANLESSRTASKFDLWGKMVKD